MIGNITCNPINEEQEIVIPANTQSVCIKLRDTDKSAHIACESEGDYITLDSTYFAVTLFCTKCRCFSLYVQSAVEDTVLELIYS